jgi:hypothetical protein
MVRPVRNRKLAYGRIGRKDRAPNVARYPAIAARALILVMAGAGGIYLKASSD